MNTPSEINMEFPAFAFLYTVPTHPASRLSFPEGNRIGALLFREVLKAELLAEGIMTSTVACGGELNRSFYAVSGTTDERVPEIVKRLHQQLLLSAGLLQCYRISLDSYRLLFPEVGPPIETVLQTINELRAEDAMIARAARAMLGLPPELPPEG